MKESPRIVFLVMLIIVNIGIVHSISAQDSDPDHISAEDSAPSVSFPPETPEHKAQRMKWWREARFGMFIHWGVYAVPAGMYKGEKIGGIGEWIMSHAEIPVAEYRAYAKDFTASKYDPEAWVALAKRAGMRYIVITAKHHEGFTLFDSKVSDWNSVKASGAKRDLIVPLEKAVRAAGLRFGLYYSQSQDWVNRGSAHAPKWDKAQEGDFDEYLKNIAIPQVDELLSKFHPDLLWWDTPGFIMTPQRVACFLPVVSKYPELIMNDRLGVGWSGDFSTPEQHIPPRGFPGKDFETCMTMNSTWGYRSYDENWMSVNQILQRLSDISSKGGNFLLNVGPTAEGVIPQASVDRLEAVGKWMEVNGDGIQGTQASPFAKKLPWGRVTRKPDPIGEGVTLYLHVWYWPDNSSLVVPHCGQNGATAKLLATKENLPVAIEGDRLVLTIPAKAPDPDVSMIALHLPNPVVDNEDTLVSPDSEGVVRLGVTDADPIGSQTENIPIRGSGVDAYLGPWTDYNCRIDYQFRAPQAQKWLVQAEIGSTKPATLHLAIHRKQIVATCEVPSTGGDTSWKTVDLGTVSLQKGEPIFTIKGKVAGDKSWFPVNIRNVTLRPTS